MDKPKISVIVPIYKVEKYLMQCIDSILNQTLKDIEVILVDEGDLDECRAIIDMYEFGAKKDERVRTIHEKNGGYGASCNKGFDIAQGEYISIIESDDFIEPTMYEEMYNYAKKLDADIVKTPYYEYWDKTTHNEEKIQDCFWKEWVKDIKENILFSVQEYPIFMGIHPSVWSCIYKKEYIDKFNIKFLSNKGAFVDHHFKILSLLNTNKIAWYNKSFYNYRLSNENASASKFNISVAIKRWREVHDLINENYPDKNKYFAVPNFREEYVNTFEKLFFQKFKITENDCEILKQNINEIPDEVIKSLNYVPNKSKAIKMLLDIKRNPDKLNKYICKDKKKNNNNFDRFYLFGCPLFSIYYPKRNTTLIKLFKYLLFLKIKERNQNVKKVYLFGLIPIAKYEKG